ncbi:MAG: hypothetical protein [Arizlama microvirus]|nr:MAG: hypothetical protein [Arizlama microvirus]
MSYRSKMSSSGSKKNFKKNAGTKKINHGSPRIMRGGIRL